MTRREQRARYAGNLAGRGEVESMRTRTAQATQDGHWTGIRNIHWMRGNYRTGVEYIAWLKGWRAGQRELADQIQRETGMPQRAAAMIVGISERVA